ncbi:MAG: tyrosine-protein phosphatase [Planctomycetes bacterium]|nr:tyrosine-protein phosphatase [Planctomycetota bacterium]
MPENVIHSLKNAPNFRDVGGHMTTDGRRVKTGLVFRSDDLYDITDKGLRTLTGLDIRFIIDFRTASEVATLPDRRPASLKEHRNIPIDPGRLMGLATDPNPTAEKNIGLMISCYRELAYDYRPSFREFFQVLADPKNIPLLFHCTAGKDRTGFAAALFLSACGVAREAVTAEYLSSNKYLAEKYVEGIDCDEVWKPLYQVRPEYLDAAFEVIDARFDGMESYLVNEMGVDLPSFREMFTEPV